MAEKIEMAFLFFVCCRTWWKHNGNHVGCCTIKMGANAYYCNAFIMLILNLVEKNIIRLRNCSQLAQQTLFREKYNKTAWFRGLECYFFLTAANSNLFRLHKHVRTISINHYALSTNAWFDKRRRTADKICSCFFYYEFCMNPRNLNSDWKEKV